MGRGEKSLLFFDPERRSLQRWIDSLHEETNTVTAYDLAGKGVTGPLAGMPGAIFAPAGGGGGAQGIERVERRSALGLRDLDGPAVDSRGGTRACWSSSTAAGRGPQALQHQSAAGEGRADSAGDCGSAARRSPCFLAIPLCSSPVLRWPAGGGSKRF